MDRGGGTRVQGGRGTGWEHIVRRDGKLLRQADGKLSGQARVFLVLVPIVAIPLEKTLLVLLLVLETKHGRVTRFGHDEMGDHRHAWGRVRQDGGAAHERIGVGMARMCR